MTFPDPPPGSPQRHNLSYQRTRFTADFSALIFWINRQPGLTCFAGEIYRPKEMCEVYAQKGLGIIDSLHGDGLAGDLLMFLNGVYQGRRDVYAAAGEKWKSLDPLNRWGGDFKRDDADHFERRRE